MNTIFVLLTIQKKCSLQYTGALAFARGMVQRTFSVFPSPDRMRSLPVYLLRTGAAIVLGTLLLSSIAYAQTILSAEMLERNLTDLRKQWETNQQEFFAEQERLHTEADTVRTQLCEAGRLQFCPGVDIKKLARAVAVAETQNCTTGVGATHNNCFGIKGRDGGVYAFREFASPEESYAAFEGIWLNGYGDRFPTIEDARRWTASDGEQWLGIVATVYNRK